VRPLEARRERPLRCPAAFNRFCDTTNSTKTRQSTQSMLARRQHAHREETNHLEIVLPTAPAPTAWRPDYRLQAAASLAVRRKANS
jgi:hypothetical protein